MANPAPLDPKVPATTTPGAEAPKRVELPLDEKLRIFWEKNAKTVYTICVIVLVAILARGAFDYYQRRQEAGIEADFAAAKSPEKLKTFISAHPQHSLAGVALLNLADTAYANSNYTEAAANYQRAAEILKTGPLAGRSRLGAAVAKVNGGDKTGGEEALKKLANDATQLPPIRSEAAYHAATIAAEAGRVDDATKLSDLATTVDQAGMWSQRAMMLRATLPVPAAAPAANDATIKLLPGNP